MPTDPKIRWAAHLEEISAKVDYRRVYEENGVETIGEPNARGLISCYGHPAISGPDAHPSAAINIYSGIYTDFRLGESIPLFSFLQRIGAYPTISQAKDAILEEYEVKPLRKTRHHFESGVEYQEWVDTLAITYTKKKPPITIEGLKKSGAQMCTYNGIACFCWQVFSERLDTIGLHFMRRDGEPFELPNNQTAKSITKKLPGTSGGFIGDPGVSYLYAMQSGNEVKGERLIYWVEGGTDLAAAYSAFPACHNFISNPCGCAEVPTQHQLSIFSQENLQLYLISDSDTPGIWGATKKQEAVAKIQGASSPIILVPFKDCLDRHGKDIRDFLSEVRPKTLEEFRSSLHVCEKNLQDSVKATINRRPENLSDNLPPVINTENILGTLGIKVCDRKPNGEFTLFNFRAHQSFSFSCTSKLSYDRMALELGEIFRDNVKRNQDAEHQNPAALPFSEVKEQILIEASKYNFDEEEDLKIAGNGICRTPEHGHIAIISGRKMYRLVDEKLELIQDVKWDGLKLNFETQRTWLDAERFSTFLAQATDFQYRKSIHDELLGYLNSWGWSHPSMPLVVSGLLYATWIQSLLKWRPYVVLVGEAAAGKTAFFQMLSELFLNITPLIGKPSVQGVVQFANHTNGAILIDEFDNSNVQQELLSFLRLASRGSTQLRGTKNFRCSSMKIEHLAWIAGIFINAKSQTDADRMIALSIKKTATGKVDKPSPETAERLGYGILAGALVCLEKGLENIDFLLNSVSESTILRSKETYAPAIGMLGAILGWSNDKMETAMIECDFLKKVSQEEADLPQRDEIRLLDQIFRSVIYLGPDAPEIKASVSSILFQEKYAAYIGVLESYGITTKILEEDTYVAFHARQISSKDGCLRGTEWEGNEGIGRLFGHLKELLGFFRYDCRINGAVQSCWITKMSVLRENFS